jgi:superfamily II DNA or RNA helicase
MHDTDTSASLEALQVLTGLARGRFGRIAPERIALHLIAATPEADWPVRRAALDALARRYSFATRDGVRIAQRPESGVLGTYRTRSAGKESASSRAYDTAFYSLDPLRTSCGCADFVRSSLGLCKHGLVVLETLERSRALSRVNGAAAVAHPSKAQLGWDFVHPLRKHGSRLERLRYVHRGRAMAPSAFTDGKPSTRALGSADDTLALIVDLERRLARGTLEAEPAVITLLGEEKRRAEQKLAAEQGVREASSTLSRLARKLYPYQRESVKRFLASGRLLLADDMGLGKTTQAIAACHALFETGRVQHGLLIVPASLKPQWKREWEATTHVPITLVEGSPDERRRIYVSKKPGFLLIGYEQLLRDFAHVQRFSPEMVVLDEAQRIKNWATKSAAYVKALDPPYRLVLTGTPMENRFDELASIMDFVDDTALEPKWRLVPLHQIQHGDGANGVGGARNLDVLRSRLAPAMLRRVRSEVLTQLPSRTDTRVPVELTEAQKAQHEELDRPIAELVSKTARRPLTPAEFLRLMQLLTTQRIICNGLAQLYFDEHWPRCEQSKPTPHLMEGLFAPKLAVLRGLVEQVALAQHRKIVIFSQWRAMLRLSEWAVRDLLASAGLRSVFFTGAESTKLRERAVVDFHDDPSVAVMFLSDAGGVGLNLQRAASCCINLELPWNPAVLEQRIGRIYRLGQKLPIDVYNLVSEGGIESRIARLLGQKKAVFSSLFDGTTDEVLFDGQTSFLASVKQLVDIPTVPNPTVTEEGEEEPKAQPEHPATFTAPSTSNAAANGGSASHAGLSVSRTADGGLRIEAPPELAAPLAELLEGLAKSLRAASSQQP